MADIAPYAVIPVSYTHLNVLESGIEIEVSPPGKVIKNLSALSGGEQALVAISIYFAILNVNPAVSYTHLDVYKRQWDSKARLRAGHARPLRPYKSRKGDNYGSQAGRIAGSPAPVSYTHLDVYKRQAYAQVR